MAYELMVVAQLRIAPAHPDHFRPQQADGLMMWHATANVKLPDIQRVLAGVPDDLAKVIQRLIAKDQSQRYRSAGEALRDLQTPPGAVSGSPPAADLDAEAEAVEAVRRKKKVRNLPLVAGGVAAMLCMLIGVVMLGHQRSRRRAASWTTSRGRSRTSSWPPRNWGWSPPETSREPLARLCHFQGD